MVAESASDSVESTYPVDVLDQDRTRFGPIGPPQLIAMDTVVGGEEQSSPPTDHSGGARINVLNHVGAPFGTIRFPQRAPVGVLAGGEEQRFPHISQISGIAAVPIAGLDILDQHGALLVAHGLPQLFTMGVVV